MSQPPSYIYLDKPNHVFKLHKAIYGLKQAPRAWYQEFRKFLIAYGFCNSHADTSIFILNSGVNIIYLLVYVEDIIIMDNDDFVIQKFMQLLSQQFSLKNLGQLTNFLGVEVTSNTMVSCSLNDCIFQISLHVPICWMLNQFKLHFLLICPSYCTLDLFSTTPHNIALLLGVYSTY